MKNKEKNEDENNWLMKITPRGRALKPRHLKEDGTLTIFAKLEFWIRGI